jgi:hypothetical protein
MLSERRQLSRQRGETPATGPVCNSAERVLNRRMDVNEQTKTTPQEARRIGDEIGVDWGRFDLEQFRAGLDVEFEHGSHDPQTDVTGDDPILTGKIALAHMKEFPDYYARLERMEQQAKRDWAARPHGD